MVRRLTGRVRVPHAVTPHVALSQHAHRWTARGPRAHSPSSIPPTCACLCLSACAVPQVCHGAGEAPSSRASATIPHRVLACQRTETRPDVPSSSSERLGAPSSSCSVCLRADTRSGSPSPRCSRDGRSPLARPPLAPSSSIAVPVCLWLRGCVGRVHVGVCAPCKA